MGSVFADTCLRSEGSEWVVGELRSESEQVKMGVLNKENGLPSKKATSSKSVIFHL